MPKAKVGDLVLTNPDHITGYEDEGFENQLCIVKKIDIEWDNPMYVCTTLADNREVLLWENEFTSASEEQSDG